MSIIKILKCLIGLALIVTAGIMTFIAVGISHLPFVVAGLVGVIIGLVAVESGLA